MMHHGGAGRKGGGAIAGSGAELGCRLDSDTDRRIRSPNRAAPARVRLAARPGKLIPRPIAPAAPSRARLCLSESCGHLR